MDELRKPTHCPKCGDSTIRQILYGLPTDEAFLLVEKGEAVLGGCVVTDWMADWRCGKCDHEWFDADDPVKQAMEDFLAGRPSRRRDNLPN